MTLGVSRSAVRSALAVLEGEGRIVRVAGSGTYVAECEAGGESPDVALLSSPAHIMEARLMVEPRLAHLVCANATTLDFAAMQRCVEAGERAQRVEVFETWDAALHEAIAAATKNPVMMEAYRVVAQGRDGSEWGELKRGSLTVERRALYQADHARIVEALRRRNARAGEAAMRAHLLRVREDMLGF